MTTIPSKRFPENETNMISNIKKDSVTRTPVDRLFNCWEKISIVVSEEFMVQSLVSKLGETEAGPS